MVGSPGHPSREGDPPSATPSRRSRGRAFLARFHLSGVVGVLFLALLAADAARPPERQVTARAMVGAVRTYQRAVPESGPLRGRCRMRPTCSAYAVTVIQRFGALRGGWLSVRRLLRCGPWTPSGTNDPPPAASRQ